MTRQTKIYIGGGIVGLGVLFFVSQSIRRKKLFKDIKEAIGYAGGGNLDSYDRYFDPNYWTQYNDGNYYMKDGGTILSWVNTLYEDGFSSYNDDEEVIYGVFRQIPDGVALSQLAAKYQEKKGDDLKEKIMNNLDKDEVIKISTILSKIPPYRRAS